MKYRVKYLLTARKDREAVRKYLSQYSITAFNRIFAKIKENMEMVKNNPYMYEIYERRPQFRRMVVEDYLLFYKVNEAERIIEVHRILHGAVNIETRLSSH